MIFNLFGKYISLTIINPDEAMRRTFNFLVIPICSVLLIILQTPEIIDKVKGIHLYAPMAIACALILMTVISTYLSNYDAQKVIDHAREKRWVFINDYAEKALRTFALIPVEGEPLKLSVNIMVPKRKLFAFLEPCANDNGKTKLTFFPKVLEIVYRAGEGSAHSNLKFTVNQGICGEAFRDEHFVAYDLAQKEEQATAGQTPPVKTFNMNKEQLHITHRVKMVASFPIFWKNNTPDRQDYKILGIVNVECEQDGSHILIRKKVDPNDKYYLTEFYNQFFYLASLYSQNHLS